MKNQAKMVKKTKDPITKTGQKRNKSPFFLEGYNSKASNKMFKMFKAQASVSGERETWRSVLRMAPFKRDNKNV